MPNNNPKRNLIRGAAWTVGARWVIKALGFVNTIIMARILMPEDYGIVAMGMLVVGLIQTFLDFGATTALLRKAEVTSAEIDSAWTLRLMQGIGAGILIFALIPIAVAYFKEPRLTYVLGAFGFSIILASANNIGQTLAQKQFNYSLDFKINTIAKLASVVTTIGTGVLLQDYRALVFGIMAGYTTPLILSYALHPYRPRWNTSKIGDIWAVTKWLLLANIGGFILRRGDELVAGRIGTTHEFGLYNVGADLGQLPVGEIGPAMMQALLPVLSSIQHDIERTKSAVIKTLGAVCTVIWPIALGFIAIAPQATELLLGAKWLGAVPIVISFAMVAVIRTTADPPATLLVLKGNTKTVSQIVWFEFIVFAIAALVFVPKYHLLGLAIGRIVSSLFCSVAFFAAARHKCSLPLLAASASIGRPMLGASFMYFFVTLINENVAHSAVGIGVSIAFGVVFFVCWSFLTWHLFRRPEGLESTVFDKISQLRKKARTGQS